MPYYGKCSREQGRLVKIEGASEFVIETATIPDSEGPKISRVHETVTQVEEQLGATEVLATLASA